MRSRILAKLAAIICAICLAMGVMSQTVFAGDVAQESEQYRAEQPEATFVVLGDEAGVSTPLPETDNRRTLPLYLNGAQVGACTMMNGEPYVGVQAFCTALGLPAQVADNGAAVSLAVDGVVLLAQVGQAYFTCNDRYLYLDSGVQTIDGAVALPVESVVKCLGITAYWDRVGWTLTVNGTVVTPMPSGENYYNESDVYWLSRLIYATVGGQPLETQVAVGSMCVNRMNNDAFPGQNNIYDVIFAKNQFDVVANGMIYVQADETSTLAAKLALEGCDIVNGAAYMADGDMGAGYECVADIGGLRFYKAA